MGRTERRKAELMDALKRTGHTELMDPSRAAVILLDLVNLDQTPLKEFAAQLAGHDQREISSAMVSAALEIISRDWENAEGFYFGAHKEVGEYRLGLSLHDDSTQMVYMCITEQTAPDNTRRVVENDFVYDLREWNREWSVAAFAYYSPRGDRDFVARLDGRYDWSAQIKPRETPLTIQEAQLLLLGLRWAAANLLMWDDPGIVWPEDLLPRIDKLGKETLSGLLLPQAR